MTSIASSSSPGLSMMDARIGRAASAGKISTTDQTALDSALTNIDSALSGGATADATSGTDMKSKIDTLIQGQVSAGTLTSDQATELQGFFAHGDHGHHGGGHGGGEGVIASLVGSSDTGTTSSAIDGTTDSDGLAGIGSASGADGPQGMQGPPPPPPPFDAGDSDGGSTATSTAGVSGSDGTEQQQQLATLIDFLQNLRASVTSNSYGSAATTTSTNTGVLINASA